MGSQGSCSPGKAAVLLDHLIELGAVTMADVRRCPNCDQELSLEESLGDLCPNCGESFAEQPGGVLVSTSYERETEVGRSVPWVLALHGMNTRGSWQEEFGWLVATTYGRSVPVFVYKYGNVRQGVFLKWRQRKLRDQLASKLRRLAGGLQHGALGSRPDVLAHSFGSWLIGHALQEYQDLKVGRVLLMGSILRPDFSWSELQARGQVESVMNHYGGRDMWARIACYFIPGSGPSGWRGFDADTGVLNREEPEFRHSSFFREGPMLNSYKSLWRPFLQRPEERLAEMSTGSGTNWREPPLILRATAPRWLLLGVVTALGGFVAAALMAGTTRLLSLL
jgi:pimeloyl-ACP methyl ester carboxylesterase